MKRCAELRALSVDHHHGLVLARTARKAATAAATIDEAWTHVDARFAIELEPHFRIEETLLAPALSAAGEDPLATRLLDDHAALRGCVAPDAARDGDALRRFADLLEEHIRFEERVLFEVAERKLDAALLAAVEQACAGLPARPATRRHG